MRRVFVEAFYLFHPLFFFFFGLGLLGWFRLHVDAGCEIEDQKEMTHGPHRWTILKLISSLPLLNGFSFIGRKTFPNQDTEWWESERILEVNRID